MLPSPLTSRQWSRVALSYTQAGARGLLELGGSPFEGDGEKLRQFAGVLEELLLLQPL